MQCSLRKRRILQVFIFIYFICLLFIAYVEEKTIETEMLYHNRHK